MWLRILPSVALRKFLPFVSGFTAAATTVVHHNVSAETEFAKDVHNQKVNSTNKESWTLYQYATCPFCCKVRTFMDYYDIHYDVVEVNPLFRKEIKFSEYRKVPILKGALHQLNDSSLIVSILKTHLLSNVDIAELITYYPILETTDDKGKSVKEIQNKYNVMYQEGIIEESNLQIKKEVKWRRWIDETFVHTLSPNIYRTMSESLKALEYITRVGNFSPWERTAAYYSGAVVMFLIGKRVKNKYRLKDDVRESLYDGARKWMKAVGKNNEYLGGASPNLADLNMYGVLRAIEGLEAFHDLMNNTDIQPWYDRMKKQVNSHAGAKEAIRRRYSV